jgi:UDP-GlcNAc:undecaprenyl-phosphate GlcNAc-1-phosphate transferase
MSSAATPTWLPIALGALGATSAAWTLALLAPRWGWLDRPERGAGARKLQRRPVPPIGGVAALIGLLCALAPNGFSVDLHGLFPVHGSGWSRALETLFSLGRAGVVPACAAAVALGLVDDILPGGLRPAAKLGGQIGVALIWIAPWWLEQAAPSTADAALALLACAVAVSAQNAINTFDNADGSALALGVSALCLPSPACAAVFAALLPFNLSKAGPRRRLPKIYLGDAGSHLLGILLCSTPLCWPALCLPLLDLLRVAFTRLRAGERPWTGDRRHLAHRLEGSGLGRRSVVLTLSLVALPSVALGFAGVSGKAPSLLGLGLVLSTALYALVCCRTGPGRPHRTGAPTGHRLGHRSGPPGRLSGAV